VGGGKFVPDPESLAAIVNMPEPSDIKMLRSFIGMASYYGQYIT
jgi:hypothetical protein